MVNCLNASPPGSKEKGRTRRTGQRNGGERFSQISHAGRSNLLNNEGLRETLACKIIFDKNERAVRTSSPPPAASEDASCVFVSCAESGGALGTGT
jgi:hypothetical protein